VLVALALEAFNVTFFDPEAPVLNVTVTVVEASEVSDKLLGETLVHVTVVAASHVNV